MLSLLVEVDNMIRYAKKSDAVAIAPLVLVILEDMELPFVKKYGAKKTLALLEESVAIGDYRYGYKRALVKEVDGKVAGVAYGYPASAEKTIDEPLIPLLEKFDIPKDTRLFTDPETIEPEWYLDSISVSKEFRGQGIGGELLAALPQIAKRDGESVIGLSVDEQNPGAKRLYERNGFKTVAKTMIAGHQYEHMQKPIA